MPPRRGSAAAAIALVLLAPAIGELLSGSTPLVTFLLSPGIAAFEIALYGCGALVVRELVVAWRRGWTSVLILGAAYGLIEEGVVLKAAFDPGWPGAAALGPYGRIGEIGSVWLVQVVFFHAVVSIALPILLVGLMFPEQRGRSWLGRRHRIWLVGLWTVAVFVAAAVVRREYAVEPGYLVVCVVVLGLIALARRAPAHDARAMRVMGRRIVAFAVGAMAMISFFYASWSGPDSERPPLATVAMQLGVAGATGLWLRRTTRSGALSDGERLALAAGVLSLFVALALPRISDGGSIIGVATLVGLFVLWRRITHRDTAGHLYI